ncbi:MAG: MBL fold metallo-hydrolase [Proteobacteria bacterium]|nr:MBL fold metallo-hydrolase [Pseudomonadota bacterium]
MNAGAALDPGPAQAGPVVSDPLEFPDGIVAVDTHYVRPRLAASHLILHGGRAAFVDTGTALAVPRLLAALAARGLTPEAVDWVWLTHVHLDHAGGAGTLLAALPNARVAVHPRGAPHLEDPARLVAATRQVYGEAVYARLYGEVRPVPAARITLTGDGERLALAGREFEFLHTPGHALHHQAIVDHAARVVFAGDTFGVSYREFDVAGREFILPATTPTQFDPEQLEASVRRVLALAPRAVFLMHYSRVTDVARLGADLIASVRRYVELARAHAGDPAALRAAVFDWHSAGLDAHGYAGDAARRHALLDEDVALNVQGLVSWLGRAR